MRREVRRVEGPEGRLQRKATAEPRAVVLLRCRMAGRAMAGEEHRAPVGDVGLARRNRLEPGALQVRIGDEPEDQAAEHGEREERGEYEAHAISPRKRAGLKPAPAAFREPAVSFS